MRKRLICVLALIVMTATLFVGCKGKDDMIEITLNEVAHSVFYALCMLPLKKDILRRKG